MRQVVVIASSQSAYLRRLVRRMCEQDSPPRTVFIGSKAHRLLFKLQSFRRIRSRLGLKEALLRILGAGARSNISASRAQEPSLLDLQQKYQFNLRTFDSMNSGVILTELLRYPTVVVLAGAGLADRATIAAVRGRCLNGHPAILPGIRGVDVLQWSLVKGVPTGVSAHMVVPAVDAGDILRVESLPPEQGESFDEFSLRLVELQADNLASSAIEFLEGKSQPARHDISKSEMVFAAPREIHDRARQIVDKATS